MELGGRGVWVWGLPYRQQPDSGVLGEEVGEPWLFTASFL